MNHELASDTADMPKRRRLGWFSRGLLFELAVMKYVENGGATQPSERRSRVIQHEDGGITVELRNATGCLATYKSNDENMWTLVEAERRKR